MEIIIGRRKAKNEEGVRTKLSVEQILTRPKKTPKLKKKK